MKNINLPLSEEQLTKLNLNIKEMTPLQLAWISGYLWGISSSDTVTENVSKTESFVAPIVPSITILSASQTGNARKIAEQLFNDLERKGLQAVLVKAGEYKIKQLGKENILLLITSTQGEGEPPEEALPLYKQLFSKKAPTLENLNYAVMALGDSSYDYFCKAGKDFDERLSELGGKRILNRTDADVFYQPVADEWRQKITGIINQFIPSTENIAKHNTSHIEIESSTYNRENPYHAEVSVNQKITARQSEKDIRHLEIDLGNSNLRYQPGDALGIWYNNSSELVSEIITKLSLEPSTQITWKGEDISFKEALTFHYELTQNNRVITSKYAEFTGNSGLKNIISDSVKLTNYIKQTSLVDMIHEFPAQLSAEEFISCLRPLTPRLYSISSSQEETENEVHITVGIVTYKAGNKTRTGGASGYLASLNEGDKIKIFIEPNDRFRLPQDNSVPIIMIGSGTGIAPYRAFIQQREVDSATGKNWLFFGNQHFISDFLYQTEWQQYAKTSLLNRIELAWSRDQPEKIYVQDKVKEYSSEIWSWIQEGAYIYVCGDATYMAKDVENTLLDIIKSEGNMNTEDAEEFISNLRTELRYQRDVY